MIHNGSLTTLASHAFEHGRPTVIESTRGDKDGPFCTVRRIQTKDRFNLPLLWRARSARPGLMGLLSVGFRREPRYMCYPRNALDYGPDGSLAPWGDNLPYLAMDS